MKAADFTRRVVRSRWLVLAAGLWIQSIAGAAYAFGIYSQSIKVAFGYDQKQLETLAVWKGIGANVGVLSGLLYDVVPPGMVIFTGTVECAFGYSMLWLSVTGRIAPPFCLMCVFICMAANSNTLFSTATVVTNVKIFPNQRGIVIGLLKGFLGLSGAILTQVFYVVYRNDPTSFLLLISWLPAVVAILLMVVIRVLPASEEDNTATFIKFSAIATCLGAYITSVIILEKIWSDQTWLVKVLAMVLLVYFLSLFVLVIKAELQDSDAESHTDSSLSDPEMQGPIDYGSFSSEQIEEAENSSAHVVSAGVDETRDIPQRGMEHTLWQAVCSLDFWLLVVVMFCSMGSGTSTIDNMGQIGASLGYKQLDIDIFVSLLSIWNFVGRFGGGLVSEILLHMRGIARPSCLAFSLALMCIGHLVNASALPGSLYVGSIITGICYGAQWSLMPTITSELFGIRHFGTLYNTITISNPVAAYFLSVLIAGNLYDNEAHKQHGLLCHGPSCFRLTFIILACVCAFGFAICIWLFLRTKQFYVHVHEKLAMDKVE